MLHADAVYKLPLRFLTLEPLMLLNILFNPCDDDDDDQFKYYFFA